MEFGYETLFIAILVNNYPPANSLSASRYTSIPHPFAPQQRH